MRTIYIFLTFLMFFFSSCTEKKIIYINADDSTDGSISGFITDKKNNAIARAQITVDSDSTLTAQTDSSGFFTITKVKPAEYQLTITHPDYDTNYAPSILVSAGLHDILSDTIRLSYLFYILKGAVTDSKGAPVSDCGIATSDEANSILSDMAGQYVLNRVPRKTPVKLFFAKQNVGNKIYLLDSCVLNDTTLLPVIALQEGGGTVSGTVYDADGAPLAGITVEAIGGGLSTVTDENGNYTLSNIPPSDPSVQISVTDPSGLGGGTTGFTVSEGEAISGMNIQLHNQASDTNGITVYAYDMTVPDTSTYITITAQAMTKGTDAITRYEWFAGQDTIPLDTTYDSSWKVLLTHLMALSSNTLSPDSTIFIPLSVCAISAGGNRSAPATFLLSVISSVISASLTGGTSLDSVENPITVTTGHPVYFKVNYKAPFGGISQLLLDFGDNTNTTDLTDSIPDMLIHIYTTQGQYTATLNLYPDAGDTLTYTLPITVEPNLIPTPQLRFPLNNDSNETADTQYVLSWYAIPDTEISYTVYLDTVKPPVHILAESITDSSIAAFPISNKMYYWRVKAENHSGKFAYSSLWNFIHLELNTNKAPYFLTDPSEFIDTLITGELYTARLSTVDPEGDPVNLTLLDAPQNLSLTDSMVSWLTTPGDTGEHFISVEAADTNGKSDTLQWRILVRDSNTVIEPNTPPVFLTTADSLPDTVYSEKTFTYTLQAFDKDIDSLIFSAPGAPEEIQITGNIISWRPIDTVTLSRTILLKVSDGKSFSDPLVWKVHIAPISSRHLKSISLSTGALSPNFSPLVYNYTAIVPDGTKTISLTTTSISNDTKLWLNGKDLLPGSTSELLQLHPGKNNITVNTRDPDGDTATYHVHVYRSGLVLQDSTPLWNTKVGGIQIKTFKDTLFVAFRNPIKITVLKYHAGIWNYVGTPQFSMEVGNSMNNTFQLIIDTNGRISIFSRLEDWFFNGTRWENMGSKGFSIYEGVNMHPDYAIDSLSPFMVLTNDYTHKTNIRKYDAYQNEWSVVGATSFSTYTYAWSTIAVYNEVPYVIQSNNDYSKYMGLYAWKYNGDEWEVLGSKGFASGAWAQIAVDKTNGKVYTLYKSALNQLSLMQYDDQKNKWIRIGTSDFITDYIYPEKNFTFSVFNGIIHITYSKNDNQVAFARFYDNGTALPGYADVSSYRIGKYAYLVSGETAYIAFEDINRSGYLTVLRYIDYKKVLSLD
ncbi:MAG: carboxypeptidase regulatory-like domain-containing protein [Fibrobacteria bacterium]|nr:carboxypeptidase regulatory-like domain-containing protein [Fibrobacteria bacterium]